MSVTLRAVLLIASVVTVAWILHQIRKFKVKMEDTIFWMFFAAVLLILAVFPEVSYWLSAKMGFMSPSNLVFMIIIFLLTEKIFTLSIIVSQLEEKISVLSAEVALRSRAADRRMDGCEMVGLEEKMAEENLKEERFSESGNLKEKQTSESGNLREKQNPAADDLQEQK